MASSNETLNTAGTELETLFFKVLVELRRQDHFGFPRKISDRAGSQRYADACGNVPPLRAVFFGADEWSGRTILA
jgi:hypothetical protein